MGEVSPRHAILWQVEAVEQRIRQLEAVRGALRVAGEHLETTDGLEEVHRIMEALRRSTLELPFAHKRELASTTCGVGAQTAGGWTNRVGQPCVGVDVGRRGRSGGSDLLRPRATR